MYKILIIILFLLLSVLNSYSQEFSSQEAFIKNAQKELEYLVYSSIDYKESTIFWILDTRDLAKMVKGQAYEGIEFAAKDYDGIIEKGYASSIFDSLFNQKYGNPLVGYNVYGFYNMKVFFKTQKGITVFGGEIKLY